MTSGRKVAPAIGKPTFTTQFPTLATFATEWERSTSAKSTP